MPSSASSSSPSSSSGLLGDFHHHDTTSTTSSSSRSTYYHSPTSPLFLRCNRLLRRLWMDCQTSTSSSLSPTSSSQKQQNNNNNNIYSDDSRNKRRRIKKMYPVVWNSAKLVYIALAFLGALGIVLVVLESKKGNQNVILSMTTKHSNRRTIKKQQQQQQRKQQEQHHQHQKEQKQPSQGELLLSQLLPQNRINATELWTHPDKLTRINEILSRQMTLEEVLQWAAQSVICVEEEEAEKDHRREQDGHPHRRPTSLVDVTSFGASGMVLLHKLHALGLTHSVPVITIDTLHLFPETYEFIQQFQKEKFDNRDNDKKKNKNISKNLRRVSSVQEQQQQQQQHRNNNPLASFFPLPLLKVYQPQGYQEKTPFDETFGADFYKTDPEQYGYRTKVEPTMRALQDHHPACIWMTGRRQSQGGERENMPILEIDDSLLKSQSQKNEGNEKETKNIPPHKKPSIRLKLNPLALWSYDDVWNYIREHQVPYNPLHDEGYKSIGDTMTTLQVERDAPERSGRFVGLNQTECGIHSLRARAEQEEKEEAAAAAAASNQKNGTKSNSPPKKATMSTFCGTCLDLDQDEFVQLLESDGSSSSSPTSMNTFLIEFYSPRCMHCVHFAPVYDTVASALQKHNDQHDKNHQIQATRYDVTHNRIPQMAKDMGFVVPGTPTVYLVQRQTITLEQNQEGDKTQKWKLIKFTGYKTESVMIEWIHNQTNVKLEWNATLSEEE